MEETQSFIPLLLVLVLAFLVPLLLSRVKRLMIPIVVGEIFAGVLIGPSVLGWVTGGEPLLTLLAEFGFVFLMFLSGIEIDFSNLKLTGSKKEEPDSAKRTWGPAQIGTLTFLGTIGLAVIFGFVAMWAGLVQNPWMLALILSTTSLGVVLPVLKERGLSTGRYGQTLLVSALIADFITMILITVLVAALSRGITLDVLLLSILFVAFVIIYRAGNLFFNRFSFLRSAMDDVSHTTGQIKMRLALTIMIVFVVLAEILGAEVILGAFLAGAIVALLRTPEDADVVAQLEAFGFGFFIPVFFIMVGVSFNLQALLSSPENLLLALVLLVAAFTVKFLPALFFKLAFEWRQSIAAGALLSARLSLIIAASAIALRLGVISDVMNAEIILIAIVTVSIAPLIFNRLIPVPPPDITRPIIVAGAGQLGLQVAERLRLHHDDVIIIDRDQQRVSEARRLGFSATERLADCPDKELSDCFDQAQALVCTHNDSDRNYRICQEAKTVYGIDHIVALVNLPVDIPRFEKLGVIAVNAVREQPSLLDLLTRNPGMYDILTGREENKEILEVDVSNQACSGSALGDLSLPGDVLVLSLRRDNAVMIPDDSTKLELGDHLTLIGSIECIESARNFISGKEAYP